MKKARVVQLQTRSSLRCALLSILDPDGNIACSMLHAVCSMLYAVYGATCVGYPDGQLKPYVACSMLYAPCCMLCSVWCDMCRVSGWTAQALRRMLHAVCSMLYAPCCMLHAVCSMLYAPCCMQCMVRHV
jgi:hypothetical protein